MALSLPVLIWQQLLTSQARWVPVISHAGCIWATDMQTQAQEFQIQVHSGVVQLAVTNMRKLQQQAHLAADGSLLYSLHLAAQKSASAAALVAR